MLDNSLFRFLFGFIFSLVLLASLHLNAFSSLDNNCMDEYKAYVQSKNRLIQLTSEGKGDTPEGKKAEEDYQLKSAEYASCSNQLELNGLNAETSNNSKNLPNGPEITKVIIAIKALSSARPDPDYITDNITDTSKPFYLFVYYKNFKTTDRIDMFWYYLKNDKEILLFKEKGGHLSHKSGVFSGVVSAEGNQFPQGFYKIVFKINGKDAYKKEFYVNTH